MVIKLSKIIDKATLPLIFKNIYNLEGNEFTIDSNKDFNFVKIDTEKSIETILKIDILQSGFYAALTLLPPINIETRMDKQTIIRIIIDDYKIEEKFINDQILDTLLESYNNNILVFREIFADGVPPKKGTNVSIKVYFDLEISKPKVLPNGQVNFKDLKQYVFVKEGDILLKKTHPIEGIPGVSVNGKDLPPPPVKDREINALSGVTISEDGTTYTAAYAGQLLFYNNNITINPFLTITGNLDYKSGNIVFGGTVDVTGDALAGFSIDAENIIIQGIYEDAILKAENSISIKTGIKGKNKKGEIVAKGNVFSRYAENANINTLSEAEIEKYCYNSDIVADRIICDSSSSVVVGGNLIATTEIRLFNAGSKGSNDMLLQAGISLIHKKEAEKLITEIDKSNKSMNEMKSILSKLDLTDANIINNPKVKKILDAIKILKTRLPAIQEKYNEHKKKSINIEAIITINGTIHQGVTIKLMDSSMIIPIEMSKVKFFYDKLNSEIKFENL